MDRSCSCSSSLPTAVPRAPANHLKALVSISAAPCPSKSRQSSCRRSVAAAHCHSFIENSCGHCCFLLQLHLKFLPLLLFSFQPHRKFLWSLLLTAPASSQVPAFAAALASASSQLSASENHQKKGDFVHYRRDYITFCIVTNTVVISFNCLSLK